MHNSPDSRFHITNTSTYLIALAVVLQAVGLLAMTSFLMQSLHVTSSLSSHASRHECQLKKTITSLPHTDFRFERIGIAFERRFDRFRSFALIFHVIVTVFAIAIATEFTVRETIAIQFQAHGLVAVAGLLVPRVAQRLLPAQKDSMIQRGSMGCRTSSRPVVEAGS